MEKVTKIKSKCDRRKKVSKILKKKGGGRKTNDTNCRILFSHFTNIA